MSEKVQLNTKTTETKLKEAFTIEAFVAYRKLGRVKWIGEQTDVYIVNYEDGNISTFITCSLDHISTTLQQFPGIKTMDINGDNQS